MKSLLPPIDMDERREVAIGRRKTVFNDDDGVSEIIGVVMLLAMVISILGLVLVALKPYVDDFDDNKNWSSAQVLTEQLQERINVVGSAPNGTGVAMTMPLTVSTLRSLDLAETWMIQADLYGNDRVGVSLLNTTSFEVSSQNETIASIAISNDGQTDTFMINGTGGIHTVDTNQSFETELIIDVFDSSSNLIHRFVRLQLSGLQMDTDLNTGIHNVAMMNNGLMSRMPNEAWSIEKYPKLNVEQTLSGKHRVSLMLTDVDVLGTLGSGKSATMEIMSKGPITLFDGEARNMRFSFDNQIHDNINPQYTELWTGDYTIHQATGDTSTYHGFGPWGRSSGTDGVGFFPNDEVILLEIGFKRVEVD